MNRRTKPASASLLPTASMSLWSLACCLIAASCASSDPWRVDPATGLRVPELGPVPELPEWPDNADTPDRRALGRAMFNDPRLSGSGTSSCALCHAPPTDFQSALSADLPDRSLPELVPTLPRNAPALLNVIYAPVFRWDGSHPGDVYDQMVLPFAEPNMNLTPNVAQGDVETVDVAAAQVELKRRLTVDAPGYVAAFEDTYDVDLRELPAEQVWRFAGKAMASYMRAVVSRDAPFDRWNAGDDDAMDAAAVRGLELFRGKSGCIICHGGPLFSDFQFHNVSTSPPGEDGSRPDEGRARVTGAPADGGAFLTPTLRSVVRTSPYFHDGSQVAIRQVIRHKTGAAARVDPNHDPILDTAVPELSDAEVEDLVAFLTALKGQPVPRDVWLPPAAFP